MGRDDCVGCVVVFACASVGRYCKRLLGRRIMFCSLTRVCDFKHSNALTLQRSNNLHSEGEEGFFFVFFFL